MKTTWSKNLKRLGLRWQSVATTPLLTGDRFLPKRRGASLPAAVQTLALVAVCLLAGLPIALPAATNDLTGLLQKGLFEEEASRNLDAASAVYETLVKQFDKDRQIGATAIFRLGEVYRKQGKTNEAVAQYERIVRDFADQTTLVTLSRQNLAGLGIGRGISRSAISTTAGADDRNVSSEARNLAVKLEGLKTFKSDPEKYARAVISLFPDEKVTKMLVNLSQLREQEKNIKSNQTNELSGFNVALRYEFGEQRLLIPPNTPEKAAAETQKQMQFIAERVSEIIREQEIRLEVLQSLVQASQLQGAAANHSENRLVTTAVMDEEEAEIRRIQALIQNSPDLINAPGSDDLTPLHQAANAGRLTVARFLLDNGANVNSKTGSAETALTLAAARGHRAMVELLLARGAEVNAVGDAGYTALHQTALFNFKAVAETLLASKANIHATATGGRTPLHLAVGAGNTPLVELLLAHGAKVNAVDDKGQSPLAHAAVGGQAAAAKALLAGGAEPDAQNASGQTALSFAARKGSLDAVKVLLEAKADPNAGRIDLPLAWAAYNDNGGEIAELLLQAEADPNLARNFSMHVNAPGEGNFSPSSLSYGPYTPLQIAVARNRVKLPGLFFKFKADPNTAVPWFSPVRPLIGYAINDVEMFRAFLDAGADPDALHRNGEPLLVTAAGWDSERTELLLTHGAKVNVRGYDDRTPLHAAAEKNDKKIVELLLAAKAEVDAVNKQGWTALRLAVNKGAEEIAELLLSSGADVNQKDGGGSTPLHWAVSNRQKEICELFLKHGAEPNAQNNQSQTPLDWAKALPTLPPVGTVLRSPGVSPQNTRSPATPAELIALLKQHGALDDLPDFSKIRLSRAGLATPLVVFQKDTNALNRFTVLEAVRNYYPKPELVYRARPVRPELPVPVQREPTQLPFPDFSRITITRRTGPKAGEYKEIEVNVLNSTNGFDAMKDVTLEFGDVVEIREREHALSESPMGLTGAEDSQLTEVLGRKVTFVIKGQRYEIVIQGQSNAAYLSSALQQDGVRKILRSSSDLSRLKVKRADSKTRQPREILTNPEEVMAGKKPIHEDLWLRAGDVIEVPDKP